jgi:hypothetical protein
MNGNDSASNGELLTAADRELPRESAGTADAGKPALGDTEMEAVGEGLSDRVGHGDCDRVRDGDCECVGHGEREGVGGGMHEYGERWKLSSRHPEDHAVQR